VNTFKDSYRVVSIDFVKNNECHLNILLKQGEGYFEVKCRA
jgi:hypothetical protein